MEGMEAPAGLVTEVEAEAVVEVVDTEDTEEEDTEIGHRDVVIPEAGVVVGPGQGGGEADPEVVLMNVVTEATHLQSHDQGQDPAHTTPNRDQNLVQSLDQNPDQSLSRLALSHHAEV